MQDPEPYCPIEPDLLICDAHHHLWDRPGQRYMLEDLLLDIETSGHAVARTVFVESGAFSLAADGVRSAIAEARMAAFAACTASRADHGVAACEVIVGYADLRLGNALSAMLDDLIEATNGRLRAIRQCGTWDQDERVRGGPAIAPPGLYSDPSFRAGLAVLERRNLAFDCWAFQTQHDDVLDLVSAFPGLRIVYNHVGGVLGVGPYAGRLEELYADWLTGMTRLASMPNLVVKLGGLGMRRSGFAFPDRRPRPNAAELADAWRPWLDAAISLFGPERCMFESNFPVDRASCDYGQLWNAFKLIAAGASQSEKRWLFHDTAVRFYR